MFWCISGSVSDKDVSSFLSKLRLSAVCDAVMPLSFSENVSTTGVLTFSRFPAIFGYDWDKLLIVIGELISTRVVPRKKNIDLKSMQVHLN